MISKIDISYKKKKKKKITVLEKRQPWLSSKAFGIQLWINVYVYVYRCSFILNPQRIKAQVWGPNTYTLKIWINTLLYKEQTAKLYFWGFVAAKDICHTMSSLTERHWERRKKENNLSCQITPDTQRIQRGQSTQWVRFLSQFFFLCLSFPHAFTLTF